MQGELVTVNPLRLPGRRMDDIVGRWRVHLRHEYSGELEVDKVYTEEEDALIVVWVESNGVSDASFHELATELATQKFPTRIAEGLKSRYYKKLKLCNPCATKVPRYTEAEDALIVDWVRSNGVSERSFRELATQKFPTRTAKGLRVHYDKLKPKGATKVPC